MPSDPVTLCNAVYDIINAGTYTLSPTVERKYVPFYQFESLTDVVAVYLGSMLYEKANRCGYFTTEVEVKLAVMLGLSVDSQAEIEGAIGLCEELKAEASDQANIVVGDFALVGMSHDPIFDYSILHEHSIFQTVITLTYRG